ncbi:hypothetical protein [Streptomyces violaceusniger]|uniref:hypothetical protein n=1 Tax=Streptomyces violaceusniger TaxID=68280 RepID=UPI001883D711
MGMRLLYLIFRRLLDCLLLLGRSAPANNAEILALRMGSLCCAMGSLCCAGRSSARGPHGLIAPCSRLSHGTCHPHDAAIGWSLQARC